MTDFELQFPDVDIQPNQVPGIKGMSVGVLGDVDLAHLLRHNTFPQPTPGSVIDIAQQQITKQICIHSVRNVRSTAAQAAWYGAGIFMNAVKATHYTPDNLEKIEKKLAALEVYPSSTRFFIALQANIQAMERRTPHFSGLVMALARRQLAPNEHVVPGRKAGRHGNSVLLARGGAATLRAIFAGSVDE